MQELHEILKARTLPELYAAEDAFLAAHPGWEVAFRRYFLSDRVAQRAEIRPQAESRTASSRTAAAAGEKRFFRMENHLREFCPV